MVVPPPAERAVIEHEALDSDPLGRQTATHDQQLQIASELFATQRAALKTLVETDVPPMERELERLGAPYTPGRVPR